MLTNKSSYVSYNKSNLLTLVIYILSGQQKELYSNCFMFFFAELPQQSVKRVEQAITTAFDHFIYIFKINITVVLGNNEVRCYCIEKSI